MRFVLVAAMTLTTVHAETPKPDACRHCEDVSPDAGRLVSSCPTSLDAQNQYCRWVVRFERTGATRVAGPASKDELEIADALGEQRLVQPLQFSGDEASALTMGSSGDFKVIYAKKDGGRWRVVKIIDAPGSPSKFSR